MATKLKITALAIKAMTPGETLRDTEMLGLLARKAANGDVTFSAELTVRATGKQTRQKIGEFRTMSIPAARARVAEMRLANAAGHDPMQQATTPKQSDVVHVGDLVDIWLKTVERDLSPSTFTGYQGAMRRDVLSSRIATTPASSVTKQMFMAVIDAAVARSPSSGALTFRTIQSFLSWCEDRDHIDIRLPRARRAAPSVAARTTVITDDQLAALWRASEESTTMTKACARLVWLTGLRSGAAQAVERDWINQAGLTVPAAAMKAKRSFWVPLADFTREQLEPVMGRQGRIFGKGGTRLNNALPGLRRRALGEDNDIQWHDIRRSMRTFFAANGINDNAAEAALAHTVQKDQLAKAYQQHDYRAEAGEALLTWQHYVERLVA